MAYGISYWPDTAEIQAKLKNLVNSPLVHLKKEAMEAYVKKYTEMNKKSKEMIDEAKKFIPGGVQHNLAFNYPFPIAVNKASGAHLWDIDGNKYIDFLQAGGPIVLAHNYEPVRKKVMELEQECGPVTGLFHEYELKLAKLVNQHMPSCEMFRSLGTGTESDMAAIRLARTATGKSHIFKAGGAYHGWSDQLVFGLHIPGSGSMEATGIPKDAQKFTHEYYVNDADGLREQLKKYADKGGTAVILCEPLGPESGTNPVTKDWNKQIREFCDEFGCLMIFDEVVTGFRVGLGGAQGYFGVKPDLTVFGKVIAGGYPMAGGLGGKREYIQYLAAGVETGSGKKRAYVGGTLSANPLSSVAGYWTIKEIEAQQACEKAGAAGDRLCKGIQASVEKYKLPYVAWNHGSICHLEISAAMSMDLQKAMTEGGPRKHIMEEFGCAYMAEGVITLAGSRLYTNMADTNEVIDEAIAAFDRVLSKTEHP